jgi:hypothetical protein
VSVLWRKADANNPSRRRICDLSKDFGDRVPHTAHQTLTAADLCIAED